MSGGVKGWCPSLLRPMQAADGWLLRVKPPAGRIAGGVAKALAARARQAGKGQLELTQRGALQLRGLAAETLEPLARWAIAQGLAVADPALEARRNILVSPLADSDPSLLGAPLQVAATLEAGLAARSGLAALPDKFGFLVDGGGLLPLETASTDIVLRLAEGRLELAGKVAVALPARCDQAVIALDLAEAFVMLAAGERLRMASLLERRGAAALLEAAGLASDHSLLPSSEAARPAPGFYRYPGQSLGAILAAWPFGALDSSALARAAALALRQGDGDLRLTPWRALALTGIPERRAEAVLTGLAAAGALVEPAAPLLRIEACPGLGACGEATVDTRSLARALARRIGPGTRRLHVSGCAKGCAHPAASDVTLVGEAGRWNLVRRGRAGDRPDRDGLTRDEALEVAGHA
ncbi:MAG: precorrin-3B synthase [Rhodospirillales bacterium]